MAQKNGRESEENNDAQKSSVDWRGRKRRQRFFGAFKLLFSVALLGALVGFGIVYRGVIMKWFTPTQVVQTPPPKVIVEPAKVVPVKPPDEPIAKPAEPIVEKVVEPVRAAKPERLVVEAEENRAKELQAEGRKLLEKFDFAGGKKKYEQAATLKASQAVHDLAVLWARKAGEFEQGTKHIEVCDYAMVETSYRIKLINGSEMQGIIFRESKDHIEFQRIPDDNPATLGRSKSSIPHGEIADKEPITLTKRQEEFNQLLTKLESGLELGLAAKAADFYDLVFLSKRLGMGQNCIDYLDRAFGRLADGQLGNAYRKLVVDRGIARAALQAAAGRKHYAEDELKRLLRTLPDYQVAKDEVETFRATILTQVKEDFRSTIVMKAKTAPSASANETRKPEPSAREMAAASDQGGGNEEVGSVDSSGVVGKGAAGPLVEKANQAYEAGMASYRKYTQGTKGNNNQVLREADKYLDLAVNLYGDALAKDPGNKVIENRQVEANMILYACRKYITF